MISTYHLVVHNLSSSDVTLRIFVKNTTLKIFIAPLFLGFVPHIKRFIISNIREDTIPVLNITIWFEQLIYSYI